MAHEGKRHGYAASGNSQIYTTSVSQVLDANKASVKELIAKESSNTAWYNKPEFQFENYKEILPTLRTYEHSDGTTKKWRRAYYEHPEFKERFEELGGEKGIRSIYTKMWSDVTQNKSEDFKNHQEKWTNQNIAEQVATEASGTAPVLDDDLVNIIGGNDVSQQVNTLKTAEAASNFPYYYETDDGASVLIENEAEAKLYGVDSVNLDLQQMHQKIADDITNEQAAVNFIDNPNLNTLGNAAKMERLQAEKSQMDEMYQNQFESKREVASVHPRDEAMSNLKAAEVAGVAEVTDQKVDIHPRDEAMSNLKAAEVAGVAEVTDQKVDIHPRDEAMSNLKAAEVANLKALEEEKKEQLLQDEKDTVGLKGHVVNDGTVSKADQAIFDKAKELRTQQQKEKKSKDILGQDDIDSTYQSVNPNAGQESLSNHLAELRANLTNEKTLSILDRMDEEREGGEKEAQANIGTFMSSKNKFKFSTFAYPRDVTQNMENGHYILFYVNVQNKTKYSYDGINESGGVVPVGDWIMNHEAKERGTGEWVQTGPAGQSSVEKTETYMHSEWKQGGANAGEIDFHKRRVLAGNKGNILRSNQAHLMKGRKALQGMSTVHKTTTRITDSVALYLPPGVSDNTSVSYNNSELGMAGFLAFSGGEIIQHWQNEDFEKVTDTAWEMSKGVIVESIKRLGLGAVGTLLNSDNLTGAFDKAFGQTVNPYIEVTFNSMGMRTFNYTFHFAPKDEQETQDVKDIIQLFRFHMAPELKGTNHRYLTLPSTFDIHYMYQTSPETAHENQFYNKIATCVLTGCDVDYTPGDAVKSFESGAPTQINMTLNFQETEMLTKQKINQGY